MGADARGTVVSLKLANEGVETRFLRRDLESVTGLALVMIDEKGAKQIMAVPHANSRVSWAELEGARGALESCRVLLLQLEVPLDVVEEAARIAKDAGALVVLDPAPPRPLPESLLRRLDVVRANAHEAGMITGIDVHDFQSASEAARARSPSASLVASPGASSDSSRAPPPRSRRRSSAPRRACRRSPTSSRSSTGAGSACRRPASATLSRPPGTLADRRARSSEGRAQLALGLLEDPFATGIESLARTIDVERQHRHRRAVG